MKYEKLNGVTTYHVLFDNCLLEVNEGKTKETRCTVIDHMTRNFNINSADDAQAQLAPDASAIVIDFILRNMKEATYAIAYSDLTAVMTLRSNGTPKPDIVRVDALIGHRIRIKKPLAGDSVNNPRHSAIGM